MIALDKGKRYLVTGGSGFLGRSLIKRLAGIGVCDVAVIARNEGQLIDVKEAFPHIEIIPGDIADPHSCAHACAGARGIFHAAAFKHVLMAQLHTRECISSNVIGTLNLLDQTLKLRPDFIIGISSDKAGRMTGVYGATKYLQETLFAGYEKVNPITRYRTVRFGNVWGSTGSFITKWKAKMQKGEEIVLTDPEATRFFWTVEQGVELIFECLERAPDSTPYIPKMKAVKMGTVLEACMEVFGKGPVRVTGLQPGENKHESMDGIIFSNEVDQFTKEEVIATFLSPQ